jgi:tetratricopeptide (TPR) repeat protein/cytochrome c5
VESGKWKTLFPFHFFLSPVQWCFMLGLIIIILLALVLLSYAVVPLLFPRQADRLPSYKDPLLQDLEEERDALFRAIRELESRGDLSSERRDQLQTRYEAKAANVLKQLDERLNQTRVQTVTTKPSSQRIPYVLIGFLGIMTAMALTLSNYVLPRVGNASVTASAEDVELGKQLKTLQEAANKNPSRENLLALGDMYWQLNDAENAKTIYSQIVQDDAAPALAFQRIGFLSLQDNLEQGQSYLEKALALEPNNLDTLYTLAEVYFARDQVGEAVKTLETFLSTPEGKDDAQVTERIKVFKQVADAAQAAQDNPSEETLNALADAYWQVDERERAADVYIKILSNYNPHNANALSRIGQVLFMSGRTEDAIGLLEEAKDIDNKNLDTLLFLGNAYFSQERFQDAITTWESYITVAGGPEKAGRIPSLIESAKARLAGIESGDQLFAANCATCHGVTGQGVTGATLKGNARALDSANVQNVIQYGRGTMPGFAATLSPEQIAMLVKYVVEVVAP